MKRPSTRGKGRRAAASLIARVGAVVVLLAVAYRPVAAAEGDLDQAYKREFAFLEAEQHTLQQRITELKAEHAKRMATARAELDALQAKVMSTAIEADRLQEGLLNVEREVDTVSEGSDVIESLLTQIDAALEKAGEKLPELPEDEEAQRAAQVQQIEQGFARAVPLLRRAGTIRKTNGSYFAESGQKVMGPILRIGSVAAYGLDDQAPGALAPAGGGKLKIWPEPGGKLTASAWSGASSAPGELNVFLFESLERRADKRAEKSVREVIDSGGIIGWVIVVGGVVAMILALLRVLLLAPSSASGSRLMGQLEPLVEAKRYDEAIALTQKSSGALARVLAVTLRGLGRSRSEIEDIVDEAVLHEQPKLDRFGSAIFVIAAVAPLLGLLGTVTGMIATFDIITEFGTGNPKLLSGGISIALVTTELGLVVAIPALVLGNLLNGWAESIKGDIDRSALHIVNLALGAKITNRPTEGRPSSSRPVGEGALAPS